MCLHNKTCKEEGRDSEGGAKKTEDKTQKKQPKKEEGNTVTGRQQGTKNAQKQRSETPPKRKTKTRNSDREQTDYRTNPNN